MTSEARDLADIISLPPENAPNHHDTGPATEAVAQQVARIARGATGEKAAVAAQEVAAIIHAADAEKPAALSALFVAAIAATPELTGADLVASVFAHLHPKEKEWFRMQLTDQCGKLLYHAEDMMALAGTDAHIQAALNRKRHGNMAIVGHLFTHGVFPLSYINTAAEFLLLRSARIDPEGALHALLLGTLLSVAGDNLHTLQPVFLFTRTRRLHAIVQQHGDSVESVVMEQTRRLLHQ
jgi:hypothetical protein